MVRACEREKSLRNDGGYGEGIQRLGMPVNKNTYNGQASSSPKFARSETTETREIEKKRDDLPAVRFSCPILPYPGYPALPEVRCFPFPARPCPALPCPGLNI